jgi:rod shape-determining protein MreD
MIGSMTPLLPIIATAPVMPPWGLLVLLAWRMLHRNLWPVWMGIPLGVFDDIFSGQPLGSAMMLWTLALLGLDVLDRRMIWRDFWQEWGIAGALVAAMLLLQLLISYATGGATNPLLLLPQMLLSILAFPLVARTCAMLDDWRLS